MSLAARYGQGARGGRGAAWPFCKQTHMIPYQNDMLWGAANPEHDRMSTFTLAADPLVHPSMLFSGFVSSSVRLLSNNSFIVDPASHPAPKRP